MDWADIIKKKEFKDDGVNKVNYIKSEHLAMDTYYFKPGQDLGYHRHPDGDQIFFVHEGEGRFYLDNNNEEQIDLKPGVVVLAPKGVWHNVIAKSNLIISQATKQPAGMEKR